MAVEEEAGDWSSEASGVGGGQRGRGDGDSDGPSGHGSISGHHEPAPPISRGRSSTSDSGSAPSTRPISPLADFSTLSNSWRREVSVTKSPPRVPREALPASTLASTASRANSDMLRAPVLRHTRRRAAYSSGSRRNVTSLLLLLKTAKAALRFED